MTNVVVAIAVGLADLIMEACCKALPSEGSRCSLIYQDLGGASGAQMKTWLSQDPASFTLLGLASGKAEDKQW